MHDPNEEHELLRRAKLGDTAAIEDILREYQPRIWRFALHMCKDEQEAQEVLQDTLLGAIRGLEGFRGDATLTTWLLTLAQHACSRRFRKSKFAPTKEVSLQDQAAWKMTGLAALDPTPNPEASVGARELSKAVAQAISELDDEQREVIVLRDVEGLTASEVAQVTGSSVAAVKSRLHRARRRVRDRALLIAEPKLGHVFGPACTPECPDILQLFSEQLEGDVSSELCAKIQDHVDQCTACSQTCESLKQTLAVCQAVPIGPVPARVQEAVRASLSNHRGDTLPSKKT